MSRVLMVFQVRRTRSSRVRKILNIATYASTPSPLRTEQAGMRAILSSAGVRGQFCKETRAVSHGVVNIEEMAKLLVLSGRGSLDTRCYVVPLDCGDGNARSQPKVSMRDSPSVSLVNLPGVAGLGSEV